jgi:hypothetical protein
LKRASNDAELLLELAKDAQVFCTGWGDRYADIEIGGHRETWPLTSVEFANWLTGHLYQSHGCAVGQAAFATAIRTLSAKASLKAEKYPVFLRVADFQGMRYLDLCNDRWEAVQISSIGWKVVAKPPVRFLRLPGMRCLPHPKRGAKIDTLRPFLGNIADDGFVLVVGYLLAVLNARGPYPLLVYTGSQGSAKSSATRITRRLIDPCIDLLGPLPHTQQEESRAVANNFIQAWDNVSQLDGRTSDRLCRLSTGGASPHYWGRLLRRCESNQRPIIMNGIVGFVRRPDLADRAMFVPLGPLSDSDKMEEGELETQFMQAWPNILGALLDGVVAGLANHHNSIGGKVGRMVDTVQWVVKCERALWGKPKFSAAYAASNMRAAEVLSEADPVASAVVAYVEANSAFEGTATDLLQALKQSGAPDTNGSRLPNGPSPLSEALTRAEPVLERLGIAVCRHRAGPAGSRLIEIKRLEAPPLVVVKKKPKPTKVRPFSERLGQLCLALTDDTDDK